MRIRNEESDMAKIVTILLMMAIITAVDLFFVHFVDNAPPKNDKEKE